MSSVQTSQFSSAAVTGWLMSCEWKRQSHVSKSRCHTCFSIEKLTRGEQLLVLVIEKINTGRTSIPCDWVIDRWGPVVLPVDWAIDSGRGFALGFDWPRSSGSSWEAGRVSLQADEGRCQLSTQLQSPSFLSASFLCPVFVVCAHMHKHTRYTVSAQSWKHVCTKKKLTLQIFSTVNLIVWVFWLADSIINLISSSSKQLFSSEALINLLHATCLATTRKHKV